jgi:hypothetical protein
MWAGDDLSYTTTWLRDGIALDAPTGDEYLVAYEDVGHSLGCRVTAMNALGSASSDSEVVLPTPLGPFLGTPGPDNLVGTYHEDSIRGYAGDDVLSGIGDDDEMFGGRGADVLTGGEGEDRLVGSFGDDRFRARDGWVDTIVCGGGLDTVVADPVDHVAADCERVRYDGGRGRGSVSPRRRDPTSG